MKFNYYLYVDDIIVFINYSCLSFCKVHTHFCHKNAWLNCFPLKQYSKELCSDSCSIPN